MANRGLIDNLMPCLVDVKDCSLRKSRAAAATAARATNINVQQLTVEALTSAKREHVYHTMLDPHTAAELTLDQIWALVDELLEAHGAAIPELR